MRYSVSTYLFLLGEILDENIVGFDAQHFAISIRLGEHGVAWHLFRCMVEVSTPWLWLNFHIRYWPKESSQKYDHPNYLKNFTFFSVMWAKWPIGLTL